VLPCRRIRRWRVLSRPFEHRSCQLVIPRRSVRPPKEVLHHIKSIQHRAERLGELTFDAAKPRAANDLEGHEPHEASNVIRLADAVSSPSECGCAARVHVLGQELLDIGSPSAVFGEVGVEVLLDRSVADSSERARPITSAEQDPFSDRESPKVEDGDLVMTAGARAHRTIQSPGSERLALWLPLDEQVGV
jgi:hypothetical protein